MAPVICVSTALLTALFVAYRLYPIAAVAIVSGGGAALVLVPAAVTALDTIFPQRKSVAELYARRAGL